MSRRARALVVCAALAGGSLGARVAHAQDGDRASMARLHFDAGVRLLEGTRFAEAAVEFEHSVALRESPVAEYNLGLAYRGAGAHRRAIAALTRFRALARSDAERGDAQVLIAESTAALVRVTLRVAGGATAVRVDGEAQPGGDGARALDLDPGQHVFEASRPGYEPDVRRAGFEPGARGAIELDAAARPRRGTLVVEPGVARARVRIDGLDRGVGRVAVDLAPGVHAVEVAVTQGGVSRRRVELAPGARTTIALAPPGEPGTPWAVWVGVAAGVVLAAATGALLAWAPWDSGPHGTWATIEALGARP